jgi:flagellar biogenesis protein FliO
LDKISELFLAALGIIGGLVAWVIRRLFKSVDRAHARINVLEKNIVDREYLETQLAPIRQDLSIILKHLLYNKKK